MGIELKGITASDGLFMGPVRRIGGTATAQRAAGTPHEEREALHAAVAAAVAEISDLMGRVEGEAQDILGFQVAMLEDDALSAPALMAIDGGTPADTAWRDALDGEIAGYEASEDDYFRARAADLKDMRDRVLRHLAGETSGVTASGAVLVGDDLAPTMFLETDWSQGGAIALTGGSATSHVAMLARARGVPMVVGLAPAISEAAFAIVDGNRGLAVADPGADDRARFSTELARLQEDRAREDELRHEPARLKDGTRIELLVNVAGTDELQHIDVRSCDGIGLMRSEFLFRDGAPLPARRSSTRPTGGS